MNCMVFKENRAMYSSTALSVMSAYALLYKAMRIFKSTSNQLVLAISLNCLNLWRND